MHRSHVITIDKKVEIMNAQMKEPPKLLCGSAGNKSCCIFRVPQSLVEINKEAYQPQIVSIGPYHHGKQDLKMIQEHKWRFLNDLIPITGKGLDFFLKLMVSMEGEIRKSYSECISLSSIELAEMMVLDGFFLIGLFRKVAKLVPTNQHDPIFRMAWVSPFLMRDLLKIENQIPFFVLQKLFDNSRTDSTDTLPSLILGFFNYMVHRPENVLSKYGNHEGKHLLDFFRESFIKKNSNASRGNETRVNPDASRLQPATKLVLVGVKFKVNDQAGSFLDIEFQNGVLMIPQINMDDFYSYFFLNCVAFEQCYFYCSKHITDYVVFMGCLMNTSTDASLLSESKIIMNYFGTDKEVTKFFSNVGKDVAFDIKNSYLSDLFTDVNKYCKNGWHVGWAGFKHTYFESPWAFISALAAFMLLSLTVIQAFYTVYPYYNKRN